MDLEKEALELVHTLNSELPESIENEWYHPFHFRSVGWYFCIEFMGEVVWNNDNDDREYVENKDEYEPLRGYVIKESNKILKDLQFRMKGLK